MHYFTARHFDLEIGLIRYTMRGCRLHSHRKWRTVTRGEREYKSWAELSIGERPTCKTLPACLVREGDHWNNLLLFINLPFLFQPSATRRARWFSTRRRCPRARRMSSSCRSRRMWSTIWWAESDSFYVLDSKRDTIETTSVPNSMTDQMDDRRDSWCVFTSSTSTRIQDLWRFAHLFTWP